MSVTLEDLVDACRRLADSNFATAAALNKLIPSFEQLRRDVYDMKADREIDQPNLQQLLNQLKTDLKLIIQDAQRTAGDVRELQREVTGAFVLKKDDRTTVERVLDAVDRAKPRTIVLVFFLLLLTTASGWLWHLLAG